MERKAQAVSSQQSAVSSQQSAVSSQQSAVSSQQRDPAPHRARQHKKALQISSHREGRAPAGGAVDFPITTSGGAPLIVDGFRRVRRGTFTGRAIMERDSIQSALASAWQKRQKTRRDMQRRTRRSGSTLGGAAPDTIIGRADADRTGARPYRAPGAKTRRSRWNSAATALHRPQISKDLRAMQAKVIRPRFDG